MQITIGSQFTGSVKDLASDGRGVVIHPSGRTFFVPGVWRDEQGTFKVTGLKGRIGFAEPLSIDNSSRSSARVTAPCQHHGFSHAHCGGCPWQSIAYPEQLAAKQQRAQQNLQRLGCADKLLPILASPNEWAYRNRAQFKTDGTRMGYVAAQSNQLVAIEHCPILSEHNQETLEQLQAHLPNDDWRPARKQKWTTLDIDEDTPADAVSVNTRRPFRQANTAQNDVIRHWLQHKLAAIAPQKTVLELFCGSGNLTEVIVASGAKKIIAVEGVDTALTQLRDKKLTGVTGVACDLFSDKSAEKLLPYVKTAEILVLDPPRDGLKVTAPLFIKKSAVQSVFYISCDLATFCRDMALFQQQGFKVKEIQPLDMFPHTPHIELMAALEK